MVTAAMPASSSDIRAGVGLLTASMLVAALLMEAALRVARVDQASHHSISGFSVYDPELGWRLAPSRTATFHGAHFAVRVSHNAEGLRDRHYDYARTPGRRRVLVLGDSVVWCWGVEHDECFTERLERTLPDTDVINAGVPGYSTAQELLFYERAGRRYGSDVVVLVVAPNDVTDNLDRRGPRFELRDGTLRHDEVPPPRRRSAANEWLQEHSRLFAWAGYVGTVAGRALKRASAEEPPTSAASAGDRVAARDDAPTAAAPADLPKPPAWSLAEALFERLAAAVAADGARLVVVLEAMPPDQRDWQLRFWETHRVPCVDLIPALAAAKQRGERVRLDGDPHLSAAGQIVLADELERVLAPTLPRLDSTRGL